MLKQDELPSKWAKEIAFMHSNKASNSTEPKRIQMNEWRIDCKYESSTNGL